MNIQLLYNPMSNNGKGSLGIEEIKKFYPGDTVTITDVTKIDSVPEFIRNIPSEDRIILCGGDGTIHHFANDMDGYDLDREIYFYPAGTGNDFLNDINRTPEEGPFVINDYITNLPIVTVNGKTRRFLNNVGFGLDGYCCEVADLQRETSKKKINYTMIALKGLLGGYHPANALVMVDGKRLDFKNVWLAPTMKGRYCGGGIKVAPSQDRSNPDHLLTVVVMHSIGKFGALTRFTKVVKGEHYKYKEMVHVIEGHEIEVIFDTPCALQIDGETVLGVLKYSVRA